MSKSSDVRPPSPSPADESGPAALSDGPLLALLLKHQRASWRQGERVPVESYLAQQPVLQTDVQAVLDLIYNELVLREEAGESPTLDEYLGRFPELACELKVQFEVEGAIERTSTIHGQDHLTFVSVDSRGPDRREFGLSAVTKSSGSWVEAGWGSSTRLASYG